MTETSTSPFTVFLETTEPFGREIQVIQEEAADGQEAVQKNLQLPTITAFIQWTLTST